MERKSLLETRHSHVTIILLILTSAVVLNMLLVQISLADIDGLDFGVIASFCFNLLVATVFLVRESFSKPYSLAQVHWLFIIVFMCVAPCSQYLNGFVCWGHQLSESDYITTNFLVSTWELCFVVGGFLGHRKQSTKKTLNLYDLPVSKSAVNTAILLSLFCTLVLIKMVGFDSLFARSTYSLGLDQTTGLIADQLLRGIPVFVFVVSWIRWISKRDCLLHVLITLVLMLVSAFPFALSRYSMAVIYGGLCVFCFPVFRQKTGIFPLFFLLAFLVFFPASNTFRVNDFSVSTLLEAIASTLLRLDKGFLSEDYDAYSMLYRAWCFVTTSGATFGYQLIGVLFFFIPRTLWPSKPVGSGYTIAKSQHQVFLNLSCPLPGEGLINFGFIGLMAFSFIGSHLVCRVDEALWSGISIKWFKPFYPFLAMFVFFIMRGDMLSSCSYLIGFFAAYSIVLLVVKAFVAVGDGNPV